MLKVGLTGGIASGKSTVGEMLTSMGAQLLQADLLSHDLMRPGQPVYDEVIQHFGRGILHPDGTVNRTALAQLAFEKASPGQPSRIEELNRIVHPVVVRAQEEWMEQVGKKDPRAVAIVEAALLIEAGAANRFDRLIVVTCNEEQRAARFAARQNVDLETARKEVARRMAAQLPDAEKIKLADFVIDNSGTLEQTREQVRAAWGHLSLEAIERKR